MTDYGESFASALAAELRAQKARKKVSDDQISQAVGVHRVSVSRYLTGERPIPMVVFADMCRFLEVSPVKVIDNAEQQARGDA
ncbi:helix-turn-helix transcriptional regulator [Bifidobacterium sp. ESL0704]|uniref:helix-turn-helix domain-containing protein n=1 Tax=Bifidobacterium sp. ESL0704 TaxID=2983219 RepID=UPI0023F899B2|nr:helix-turn-helix transcriptional regulator [Bifidobacterium sp. ESL0704]WEV53079.1 helix-turn-helix transcriptional regulator [Bifidobacterium sp. ESL0704]